MNVLFLALGASRKRAVVEECAQVVADGGTATVVVESLRPWQKAGFAPGVTLVDSAVLQRARLPMRVEHLVVYRAPRAVLRRVAGAGAAKAYEKKVADRFHRRVFMPAYRRMRGGVRGQLVAAHIARSPRPFDWMIVADSLSMPDAVQVLNDLGADRRPGVAYSIDHVRNAVA